MTKQLSVVWSISTSARTMQVAIGRPDSSAQRHRPRASATPGTITDTEHCCVSATTGSVGRRLLRRVTMPTTCTSATAGSVRRTATPVRTVFSCVASRNREGPLGTRTGQPLPQAENGDSANHDQIGKTAPPKTRPSLPLRVAGSGKSYELCRVARAARGGGDSRTPKECRFPDCGPIPGRPIRKITPPNVLRPRALGNSV